ncbi:MAG: DUF3788 family protein [Opitutae bacterium]|nr:DUF3788 family protein [Opitutae bacterium]
MNSAARVELMKTKPFMDPAAAFPDKKQKPGDAELSSALGRAAPPVGKVLMTLRAERPDVVTAWQFSERSGWYLLLLHKKRRLLYLVPQRGNFRLVMILGRKAIAELLEGPYDRRTARLLRTARHYPEGTSFAFDRRTLDPGLVAAFLAAKLNH